MASGGRYNGGTFVMIRGTLCPNETELNVNHEKKNYTSGWFNL